MSSIRNLNYKCRVHIFMSFIQNNKNSCITKMFRLQKELSEQNPKSNLNVQIHCTHMV